MKQSKQAILKKLSKIASDRNVHFLTILLLAAALLLSALSAASNINAQATAAAVTDWGLSFGEKNSPPRGNASAAELLKSNAYYIGDTNEKKIYLTFDAGYENGYTASILDTLSEHNAPAAFFIVAHYLETNPELILRMKNEGHIVANHTSSHPDMSNITDKTAFERELSPVEELYTEITGDELPRFYRPPQGKFNAANLYLAKELGYTTVFWSLAYVDWDNDNQPTHSYALEKLNSRIHNGAVVLLHSTSKTNTEILDELLTGWEEQGYSFGSLYELCE